MNASTRFSIDGMNCGACVKGVTAVLGRAAGVDVRHVAVGSAEVAYDSARTSPAAIAAALTAAGYPARESPGAAGSGARPLPQARSGGGCCCGD